MKCKLMCKNLMMLGLQVIVVLFCRRVILVEEALQMNQRGPGLALQVRINIAKIVISHLHYLLLKVQTLQNPVTPATLYMRCRE